MSWLEDKLGELAPISKIEKNQLTEIFERAMTQMVDEAYEVNSAIAGALEEGCGEARCIVENLKVKD